MPPGSASPGPRASSPASLLPPMLRRDEFHESSRSRRGVSDSQSSSLREPGDGRAPIIGLAGFPIPVAPSFAMAFLLRCFWLLVLAVWLPSTMHCSLEAAGIDLGDCCSAHESSDDSHPERAEPHGPCPTCSLLESGAFFLPALPDAIKPPWTPISWRSAAAPPPPSALSLAASPAAAGPLRLPPAWLFMERAAALPRPPSLPS